MKTDIADHLCLPRLKFSAQRGNVGSQSNLAAYLEESGDHTSAAAWYRFAANQDNARSQYNLGCLLLNGIGVEQDLVEAQMWFSEAAKKGYVNSIYNLAYMKEHGFGCQKDKVEAYELYTKAASHGDPDSQCKLAMILLDDSEKNKLDSELLGGEWPVSSDPTKARKSLQLASSRGHKLASEILVKLGWEVLP